MKGRNAVKCATVIRSRNRACHISHWWPRRAGHRSAIDQRMPQGHESTQARRVAAECRNIRVQTDVAPQVELSRLATRFVKRLAGVDDRILGTAFVAIRITGNDQRPARTSSTCQFLMRAPMTRSESPITRGIPRVSSSEATVSIDHNSDFSVDNRSRLSNASRHYSDSECLRPIRDEPPDRPSGFPDREQSRNLGILEREGVTLAPP